MSEDVILAPEVRARLALETHKLRMQVLVPFGSWIGSGTLRVLRLKINEDRSGDLVVGYDAYQPVAAT